MMVCFTEGWLHKTHRMFENVSYIHVRDNELLIRTNKSDLRFNLERIKDLNIYQ